jgi:uncharacterized protein YndB with AHSA1/START domain
MTEAAQDTSPIVQAVVIAAPVERVFDLLTDAEHLVRWWPDAATFEPRVGGKVQFVFEGRAKVVGEVTRFEPPTALSFTWIRDVAPDAPTHVEIALADLGDGRCRVELVHSGWEVLPEAAEWRGAHQAGWAHYLDCLADLAEGRPVDKTFN